MIIYAIKKLLLVTTATILMTESATAVNATELDDLRLMLREQAVQIEALAQQVNELNQKVQASEVSTRAAQENARQATIMAGDVAKSVGSADRITWTGDLRYRYENIDDASKSDDRDRQRIRARAALTAKVSDNVKAVLGLASGGDNPVSTNQTLGGGGSTKGIELDLAYFDWTAMPGLRVVGGKFKSQLHRAGKNGLVWDSDWNPEGIGVRYDNDNFFAAAVGTFLESDSNKDNTEFSFGVQGGFKTKFGGWKVTAGLGYYEFGTAGKSSFFGDDDDFFGNSFDPVTNTYLFDYTEIEGFVDLGFEVMDMPLSIFADYVKNTAAEEFDTGYAVGAKLGAAKSRGTWEFAYIYQDLEADAVLGLLTDSNFRGGGTDAKGHIFRGAYALNSRTALKFTYFLNENDENANSGVATDFDRLQLDVQLKY